MSQPKWFHEFHPIGGVAASVVSSVAGGEGEALSGAPPGHAGSPAVATTITDTASENVVLKARCISREVQI
jgi:hypothetical protein